MRILSSDQNLRSIVTRKTLLPPPGDRTDPNWRASWEHLFARYEPAMRRYVRGVLTRAGGAPVDDDEAADVVRDYLAQSLEKGWLASEGEAIRSFRAYLQTQLRRFAYRHLERRRGATRSAGAGALELPLDGVVDDDADPAAQELDEGWVEVAVERTLATIRAKNADYHAVLEDLLATDGEGSADLGQRMGKRPEQLVHLRHRARRRFALLFHEELRATVRDDEAFEELCVRLDPYLP